MSAFLLTVFLGAGILGPSQGQEALPFKLPDLLPPAEHPERLDGALPWEGGALLELFESQQAQLSDADRVRLLYAAAQAYGKPSAYASYLRNGPVRGVLDLGLRAARAAENADTLRLRALRVEVAKRINPWVGQREAIAYYAFLDSFDIKEAKLLGVSDVSSKLRVQSEMRWALSDQGLVSLGGEIVRSLDPSHYPAGARSRTEGQKNGFDWQQAEVDRWEGLSSKKRQEYFSAVDETLKRRGVLRLQELPSGDPHSPARSLSGWTFDEQLSDLHERAVKRFVGNEGFGIARMEVQGPKYRYLDSYGREWGVEWVELLSTLDRSIPVAYATKDQGRRMDGLFSTLEIDLDLAELPTVDQAMVASMEVLRKEGKEHPTRALSAFEKQAMPQALAKREPVIDQRVESIEMVAPMLASSSCLRCHGDVDLGEPMGAFSYRLQLVPEGQRKARR